MSASKPTTAILLLTDIPQKSHVGIDLSSFSSTSSFRGLKLVPPGLHHIWTSPAPSLSLRTGIWVLCTSGIHHLRYDATTETLMRSDTITTPDITPELWSHGLTPFRQRIPTSGEESASVAPWQALISHVSPEVLTKLLSPLWSAETTTQSSVPDTLDEPNLTALPSEAAEQHFMFTHIDLKRTWPPDAVGPERTEMARDRSWALTRAREENPELLGEMQVAFVACVYLANFSAGMHWRRIVGLVLTCRRVVVVGEEEVFFVEFLRALRKQVEILAGGDEGAFLGDEVMGEVVRLLRVFGRMLREEEEEGKGKAVRAEFAVLTRWAEKRLDWVLDMRDVLRKGMVQTEEGDMVEIEDEDLEEEEETGEYAPAIVEEVELAYAHIKNRSESPFEINMAEVDDEEDDPRY